jgi:hypothetical protein
MVMVGARWAFKCVGNNSRTLSIWVAWTGQVLVPPPQKPRIKLWIPKHQPPPLPASRGIWRCLPRWRRQGARLCRSPDTAGPRGTALSTGEVGDEHLQKEVVLDTSSTYTNWYVTPLVGGFNPLKNISQLDHYFQYGKIKIFQTTNQPIILICSSTFMGISWYFWYVLVI